ncbi:MAG: N-acetyltransferase [Alphaproteobacteria bacterium]|nr:N-acetyltransferase [Alphaproteobacteria bacterium]
MISIRSELMRDITQREALLDEAFGMDRHEKTCERLREGRMPARGLSLIADDQGLVVGTVRLWHIAIKVEAALLLGPLAVATSHQARGIGGRLMRAALNRAASQGYSAIILVGDKDYYARFGFSTNMTTGIDLPGPVDRHRFLGLELVTGTLSQQSGMVLPTGDFTGARTRVAAKTRLSPIARAA